MCRLRRKLGRDLIRPGAWATHPVLANCRRSAHDWRALARMVHAGASQSPWPCGFGHHRWENRQDDTLQANRSGWHRQRASENDGRQAASGHRRLSRPSPSERFARGDLDLARPAALTPRALGTCCTPRRPPASAARALAHLRHAGATDACSSEQTREERLAAQGEVAVSVGWPPLAIGLAAPVAAVGSL